MSNRQKRITLTDEQQQYVLAHTDETIASMAKRFGVSNAKVSMNLKFMGLERQCPHESRSANWEKSNGTFDEAAFARLYSY